MPRARLVLVDDDPSVLHSLQFAFETEGYDVRAYTHGEELLEAAPIEPTACLIIDQRLPGLSGLDTVARLRARGVAAPAILITTHPTASMIKRAAVANVGIVEKPLIGEDLAKKVRALLDA